MCTVHREENYEWSLDVTPVWKWKRLEVFHWILFRISLHLGTISAGWNIWRVEFFSFWIVVKGAILYRMPGLRQKCDSTKELVFHNFVDNIFIRWHFSTVEWDCRNKNWWFVIQYWSFKSFLIYRVQEFLVTLNLAAVRWLVGRMKSLLDFSQVCVSLLFVKSWMA